MKQYIKNYAQVLFELNIDYEIVQDTKKICLESAELLNALSNPSIQKKEKHAVINVIFNEKIKSFLKVLCDNDNIESIIQIIEMYEEILLQSKKMVKATLTYVTRPDEEQISQIKKFVMDKYNKADVLLELKEDSSLLGGFILSVGNVEYDKSIAGTLSSLRKTFAWR